MILNIKVKLYMNRCIILTAARVQMAISNPLINLLHKNKVQ